MSKLSLSGLLLFLFSCGVVFPQSTLTLVHKNKKYKIRANEECYITTIPVSNDTARDYYNIYIGYIEAYSDSNLVIKQIGFNSSWRDINGKERLEGKGTDNLVVNVNIRRIEEIENFRKWFLAPAFVGWLSLFTGVVVSPLASIKYKSGGFNTERFAKISGISLGTTAVTFTLSYGFGRRSTFLNNGRKQHKRLWHIQ